MAFINKHWALTLLTAGTTALAVNACSSSSEGSGSGSGTGAATGSGASGGSGGSVGSGGSGADSAGGSGASSSGVGQSGTPCGSDLDCGGTWPYCDSGGGQCVQCLTDTNCGGSTCDPSTLNCAGGGTGGAGGTSGTIPISGGITGGPRFAGGGALASIPLQPGFGPDTSDECHPGVSSGSTNVTQVRDTATLCFYGDAADVPVATIEQVIESVDGADYVHLRVTFDPEFADNTYGENSVGWGGKDGIRDFDKLVGSDHVELLLTDCSGATVMQFKVDYINEDPTAASGYSSGGVVDGDGQMISGDASAVLAATTSLARNFNGCGYTDYTVDSPATDDTFSSNGDTPNWDYRVVYEVWLDSSAFEQCFGTAFIEFVHASPAKTPSDTIQVTGAPCPPEWDDPYCVEDVTGEGSNCGGTTPPLLPDGGTPPPGTPPPNTDGGTTTPPPPTGCPQNYTAFPDCPSECVPIPFAGWANRAACPDGYILDLASEGQFCVPETGSACG